MNNAIFHYQHMSQEGNHLALVKEIHKYLQTFVLKNFKVMQDNIPVVWDDCTVYTILNHNLSFAADEYLNSVWLRGCTVLNLYEST